MKINSIACIFKD